MAATTTTASDETETYNPAAQTINLTANVYDGGFSVGTGSVAFTVTDSGNKTVATGSGTLSSGAATAAVTLPAGTKTGTYKIHAVYTDASPANFQGSSDDATLSISKGTFFINWENPSDITYGTLLSATQLNATASVPTNPASYSPGINSLLPAGTNQSLTVSFTPNDTVDYATTTDTVHLNVLKASTTFSGLKASQAITYGTATISVSGKLTGQFINPVGQNVTITIGIASATTAIHADGSFSATVDTHALTVPATSYPIVYKYTSDDNFVGATDTSTTLTVNQATFSINWNNPGDITYGTPLSPTQLNATASVPASTPTYSPDFNSKLPAGNNQALKVTFTPNDTTDYATATRTVHINVDPATPHFTGLTDQSISYGQGSITVQGTLAAATAIPQGQGVTIVLNGTNATTTLLADGSFSATFDTHALNASATSYTISYSYSDTSDSNFQSASASSKLKVNQLTPDITWADPGDITYGTLLSGTQLDATYTVAGSGTFTPGTGTKLGVGNNVALTFNFTPTDTTNYTTATKTVHINVLKATPTFSGLTPPQSIVVGTPTINLSGKLLSGTTGVGGVAVNISVGSATGSATTLADGSFTTVIDTHALAKSATPYPISYSFPGNTNLQAAADSSTSLSVANQLPTITWSNPAEIVYGTPLSGTQLDATASVPGNFVYSPTAGTILNAGTGQALSTTFTPQDSSNYGIASASTHINVLKATPVFSQLTGSQTITYGQGSITLSGKLTAPTAIPAGDQVTMIVGPASAMATVQPNGSFSATIDTHALGLSTSGYPVQYHFAGDANFQPANDSTTSLAVIGLLSLKSQPTTTLFTNSRFSVTVAATDALGHVITSYTGPMTIALKANPGGSVLGGTTTVNALGGVATFSSLTLNNSGTGYTLIVSGGGLVPAVTSAIGVTAVSAAPLPQAPPRIMRVAPLFSQNKKGKGRGKQVLTGFELDFSRALAATSAVNGSDFQVGAFVIKRQHGKKVTNLQPVGLTTTYNPSNNSVSLHLVGKQTFAKGGQITVIATPPAGIQDPSGLFLDGNGDGTAGDSAVYTISRNGKSVF